MITRGLCCLDQRAKGNYGMSIMITNKVTLRHLVALITLPGVFVCASCAKKSTGDVSGEGVAAQQHKTILITGRAKGGLKFSVGGRSLEGHEALARDLKEQADSGKSKGINLSVQFAVKPGFSVKGSELHEAKRAVRATGVDLWYWLLGEPPRGDFNKFEVELRGQNKATWKYVLAGEEIGAERVLTQRLRTKARGSRKPAAVLKLTKGARFSLGKLDEFKSACAEAGVVFYTYSRRIGAGESVGPNFGGGR